jgi:two-component system sensor histidine kinase YesM
MLSRSLQTKILLFIFTAIVIPLLISNLYTYNTTARTLKESFIKSNSDVLEQKKENLSGYFTLLKEFASTFFYEEDLIRRLMTDDVYKYNFAIDLDKALQSLLYSRDDVKRIDFLLKSANTLYIKDKEGPGFIETQSMLPLEYERMLGEQANTLTMEYSGSTPMLYYYQKVMIYPQAKVFGYLRFVLSTDAIESMLGDTKGQEAIFLIKKDRTIADFVYSPGETAGAPEAIREMLSPITHTPGLTSGVGMQIGDVAGIGIASDFQVQRQPFTIVKFVPEDAINEAVKKNIGSIILLQLGVLFVVICFLYFLVSISVITPIKKLVSTMRVVEKNWTKPVSFQIRNDEIGFLQATFQRLVEYLQELILKEYQYKIDVVTAQLKMLQAQINPHFLYNILQTISTMALKKGAFDISDRLGELGSILRYSMNFREETVELQREIEQIENYLSLQSSRFDFTFEVCVDSPCMQFVVPKMILQPLIENSIQHGIEQRTGAGLMEISASLADEFIVIEVTDNGNGFTEYQIGDIRKRFAEFHVRDPNEGGIGLVNVLSRLRLFYGDPFHWHIASRPGHTTTIALYLPLKEVEAL